MWTKGPWHHKKAPTDYDDYDIQAPDGDNIHWVVATVIGNCGYDESEPMGNDRLIAAAPELLEALERLLEAAETGSERSSPPGYYDEQINAARAVIKKAKGE